MLIDPAASARRSAPRLSASLGYDAMMMFDFGGHGVEVVIVSESDDSAHVPPLCRVASTLR
jgi:hypothetical protein